MTPFIVGGATLEWVGRPGYGVFELSLYTVEGDYLVINLDPSLLRDLAIITNAALASMSQATSTPDKDSASLPRSGDD